MQKVAFTIFITFCSLFCNAQNVKIGIRGGTFSPYSLYNAFSRKNPNPGFNRYTISYPISVGAGVLVEENRFLYGFGASLNRLDIQQTFSSNFDIGYATWENYDLNFSLGYKLVKSPRSSLNGLIGIGTQLNSGYKYTNFFPFISPQPDSSQIVTFNENEIYSNKKTPLYITLKLESDFLISKRWSLFLCIESNLFLNKNYLLRTTQTSYWKGNISVTYFDGQPFTNNSISSTIGFRYTLLKSKKIETPFER